MVPERINGTELMVPTQEIMVPTGPHIRVAIRSVIRYFYWDGESEVRKV